MLQDLKTMFIVTLSVKETQDLTLMRMRLIYVILVMKKLQEFQKHIGNKMLHK